MYRSTSLDILTSSKRYGTHSSGENETNEENKEKEIKKMRKEMNEMEMNEVTGGMIYISNLLFNKNQKMDIEDAIFDSKKKVNIENAILDSKERARFIPLNKERRTTIMSAMVC